MALLWSTDATASEIYALEDGSLRKLTGHNDALVAVDGARGYGEDGFTRPSFIKDRWQRWFGWYDKYGVVQAAGSDERTVAETARTARIIGCTSYFIRSV